MKKITPKGKILILSPTRLELDGLALPLSPRIESGITGVGPVETAANALKLLLKYKPAFAILAGIAGAYPPDELSEGDVVLISTETAADIGTFSGGSFDAKFATTYNCPHIPAGSGLPIVAGNSVSAAAAPFIEQGYAAIENMEGAAFFRICGTLKIPFLEIRAVSNIVGKPIKKWNIPLALENLSKEVNKLLEAML